MGFLIKAAFWLTVVVLLLPSPPQGQQQQAAYAPPQVNTGDAINAAQRVVADAAQFCARNPQACETGEQVIQHLSAKAQHGAYMLYTYLNEMNAERAGGLPASPDTPVASAGVRPVSGDPIAQQIAANPQLYGTARPVASQTITPPQAAINSQQQPVAREQAWRAPMSRDEITRLISQN